MRDTVVVSHRVMTVLASIPFSGPIGKFLFLSMLIAIVFVPTRLSRRSLATGPRRAVAWYGSFCVVYYGMLRMVIPRLGL